MAYGTAQERGQALGELGANVLLSAAGGEAAQAGAELVGVTRTLGEAGATELIGQRVNRELRHAPQFTEQMNVVDHAVRNIQDSAVPIPARGVQTEAYAPRPIRPQEAAGRWAEFLGEGPHTNVHPKTGQPDPNRLVSRDGTRSIRYGDHEMGSNPNRHHYHEETWRLNPENNTMEVDNTVVRVPEQGRQ